MENISLPCLQKPRPISNPSYSFHTLTLCNCQCTNHFNIILCHGLYIFIETITVFTKTYKKPISNHPYSVYTLTCCTFIKISASQRVLVYAVNIYIYIYMGEWRFGSTHSFRRGWTEVSGRLYCSAALSSGWDLPVHSNRRLAGHQDLSVHATEEKPHLKLPGIEPACSLVTVSTLLSPHRLWCARKWYVMFSIRNIVLCVS